MNKLTLAEFSIKKYYTTISTIILILFLGIVSYFTLPVQLNPDIEPVIISVITNYSGASATDIADSINEIIEEEIGTIEGIKKISSTAMEGTSIVTADFGYDEDIDVAAVEVQNVISRIKSSLPSEIDEPEVRKFSSSDKPILTLSLSNNKDLKYLRTLADNELKNRLQLIKGVASVNSFGGKKREIYVDVSQDEINKYNIPLSLVINRINGENVNIPGGKLNNNNTDILLRTIGKFENIEDIKNIVLINKNNNPIYLKDIAEVYDSYEDIKSRFQFNGIEGVAINILKQQDANTIKVADEVKKEIIELRKIYPAISIDIVDDQSDLVKIVVNSLGSNLKQGIFLTILIIFLFLNNIRNTFAVAVSIPTTFVFTLILMKIFSVSLNSTSMSALILSIGMLVDNSIVVIENITRHFEELNKSKMQASIDGTNEITLSVIAGTTTSMIVLFPVMFVGGFIQQAFRPLAVTLLFSWIGSILSSLTIIPMIMSFILTDDRKIKRNKISLFFHKKLIFFSIFIEFLKKIYLKSLRKVLEFRLLAIVMGLSLFIISLNLIPLIGSEMIPVMDSGQGYISLETEPGSDIGKTTEITQKVENILKKIPEIVLFSSQIGAETGNGMVSDTGASGVNQSVLSLTFTPRNKRDKSIWQIQEHIRNEIEKIPGIRSFVVKELGSTALSTTKAPLVLRIKGNDSETLELLSKDIIEQIEKIPGTTNLTTTWTFSNPEYYLIFNETKLSILGLSTKEVASQVNLAINGVESREKFNQENTKDINIKIRYNEKIRNTKEDIENIIIISNKGIKVPLYEIADVSMTKNVNLVTRENLSKTIDILGYVDGRSLSKVSKDIEIVLKQYKLPKGYTAVLTGEKDDLKESIKKLAISLLLAIVFVYFLLVSQFKSFLHPFTIMLSIPLEVIGVVFGLLITGKYLSMPAVMGIILLTGIAVNDAIHLIDFAIEEKQKGVDAKEAMLEAGRLRFRPILMTTFSTSIGMLPLALEFSIGSEKFSPLAVVVIGGLTTSTFLLLFIVPVVYTLFEDIKDNKNKILV